MGSGKNDQSGHFEKEEICISESNLNLFLGTDTRMEVLVFPTYGDTECPVTWSIETGHPCCSSFPQGWREGKCLALCVITQAP